MVENLEQPRPPVHRRRATETDEQPLAGSDRPDQLAEAAARGGEDAPPLGVEGDRLSALDDDAAVSQPVKPRLTRTAERVVDTAGAEDARAEHRRRPLASIRERQLHGLAAGPLEAFRQRRRRLVGGEDALEANRAPQRAHEPLRASPPRP